MWTDRQRQLAIEVLDVLEDSDRPMTPEEVLQELLRRDKNRVRRNRALLVASIVVIVLLIRFLSRRNLT